MRSVAYELLANTPDLQAILGDRIASSGNAENLQHPFLVIRTLSDNGDVGGVRVGGWEIHVHDDPNSYVKIDQALDAVESRLLSFAPAHGPGSDWWVMSIESAGRSEDLFDDHYGTATRYATYRWVANRQPAVG